MKKIIIVVLLFICGFEFMTIIKMRSEKEVMTEIINNDIDIFLADNGKGLITAEDLRFILHRINNK